MLRQLLRHLSTSLSWPLTSDEINEVAFQYRNTELGLDLHELRLIEGAWRLRLPKGPNTVILIDFNDFPLNRWLVRKVMIHFTTRRRHLAGHQVSAINELLFLCQANGGENYLCHFRGWPQLRSDMAVLGPCEVGKLHGLSWLNRENWVGLFDEELYRSSRTVQDRSRHPRDYFARHSEALATLFDQAQVQADFAIEEERALTWLAQHGRQWAFDALFMAHLDDALEMAARAYDKNRDANVPLQDLVSMACEGLAIGVRKHDPMKGYKLEIYARRWMANKIGRALIDLRYPTSAPAHVTEQVGWLLRDFEMREDIFLQTRCFDSAAPSFREFCRASDWSWNAVAFLRMECDSSPEALKELELIAEPWDPTAALCDLMEFQGRFDGLKPVDREVLLFRLGLNDHAPGEALTLEAIGARLGITRERVRQLEVRARKHLWRQQWMNS